jgi:ESAT-6 family protein
MAASGIRVTPEQLQQVGAQLTGGASTIHDILAQLEANVAPLGSDWAGVAQARFLDLWEQWQRNGQGVQAALTEIAQLMGRAAAAYEETEAQIASGFGGGA